MKRICSHDGSFHADDCLGTAILMHLFDAVVVRSREPEVWATCDFLVDVGGEYDPSRGRFDHHQLGFVEQRDNGIPYAGAGLVWRSYGPAFVQSMHPSAGAELISRVAMRVDENLIQHVDAVDSGISVPGPESFGLTAIIDRFNATWLQEDGHDDERFECARNMAGIILRNEVTTVFAELSADECLAHESTTLFDGRVLLLERPRVPYESFVLRERDNVRFVLYPSEGRWTVRVVPVARGSFTAKLDLPASWAGLRATELADLTGVQDAVFCHKGRFIAAAKTKEGAIELARQAL